uniref:Uncharacterized protein n=1 Tax=Globodera rostochiensis TaxID=31243 RepID=A0A914I1H0_GLORO
MHEEVMSILIGPLLAYTATHNNNGQKNALFKKLNSKKGAEELKKKREERRASAAKAHEARLTKKRSDNEESTEAISTAAEPSTEAQHTECVQQIEALNRGDGRTERSPSNQRSKEEAKQLRNAVEDRQKQKQILILLSWLPNTKQLIQEAVANKLSFVLHDQGGIRAAAGSLRNKISASAVPKPETKYMPFLCWIQPKRFQLASGVFRLPNSSNFGMGMNGC